MCCEMFLCLSRVASKHDAMFLMKNNNCMKVGSSEYCKVVVEGKLGDDSQTVIKTGLKSSYSLLHFFLFYLFPKLAFAVFYLCRAEEFKKHVSLLKYCPRIK